MRGLGLLDSWTCYDNESHQSHYQMDACTVGMQSLYERSAVTSMDAQSPNHISHPANYLIRHLPRPTGMLVRITR